MKRLRVLSAGVLAAAMLVGGTAAATAQPPVNFIDEGSFSFDPECEGLDLLTEGTFREHVLIHRRGREGLVHFQANVRVTEVTTNAATGKTFTSEYRFLDKDQSVTDNGDGTFTVIIRLAGRVKHYGPDGSLLFIDSGQFVTETVWADDGDFPTGGTRLNEELIKSVGKDDTADRDFCADMDEFLG